MCFETMKYKTSLKIQNILKVQLIHIQAAFHCVGNRENPTSYWDKCKGMGIRI